MPEIILHYIWQRQLFARFEQRTTSGRRVEVLSPGKHNLESGPDFTEVRLLIDGQEWVGNIEIHVCSSDWYRHRHHLDSAYDSVLLHVVREADREVVNSKGESIDQLVLNYEMDQDYLSELLREARTMDSPLAQHPCGARLLKDPMLLTDGWRQALLHQRLECKRQQIAKILDIVHGSWEDAFYITLSRNFGFHTNSLPFEQLAIATPLRYLGKHRNSLFQLEAMLLGQAGLLGMQNDICKMGNDKCEMGNDKCEIGNEEEALGKEYQFLRQKFNLVPIDAKMWKMGRVRPSNAPKVRIRQLAELLHREQNLFATLTADQDVESLYAHLSGSGQSMVLGREAATVVLINTVIPYRYAHACAYGGERAMTRAMEEMSALPAENNRIIRQWRELGQSIKTAADTQALIHLYQNYCQPKQCVACDVGYQIFLQNDVLSV